MERRPLLGGPGDRQRHLLLQSETGYRPRAIHRRCVSHGTWVVGCEAAVPAGRRRASLMDYKRLLSQVERTLGQIENAGSRRMTIEQIAGTIAAKFRDELGITGGRIYEATGENTYELVGRFGSSAESPIGIVVAKDYK